MPTVDKLYEFLAAAGAFGGALATLAVAEPSLESRAAFWVLFLISVALLGHLVSPAWNPLVKGVTRNTTSRWQLRKMRQSFKIWVKVWFGLDKLLRESLTAEADRRADEDARSDASKQYLVLRRVLQQRNWPFMNSLEAKIERDLAGVLREKAPEYWQYSLEREVLSSRRPLYLFYSQPNLGALLSGLAPGLWDNSWKAERDAKEAVAVLDRIEDIIREFGADVGVDVTKIIGYV